MDEPTDVISVDLIKEFIASSRRLNDEMRDLSAAFAKDSVERKYENDLRDRRITWSRRTVVIALIVAALAVWFGFKAETTSSDIVAARTDARIAACLADNDQSAKERELWGGIMDLRTDLPPEQKAGILELADVTYAQRDCSADAVNEYYSKK